MNESRILAALRRDTMQYPRLHPNSLSLKFRPYDFFLPEWPCPDKELVPAAQRGTARDGSCVGGCNRSRSFSPKWMCGMTRGMVHLLHASKESEGQRAGAGTEDRKLGKDDGGVVGSSSSSERSAAEGVRDGQGQPCLIYSFGSNGDDTWERAMAGRLPHCEIHIFDPTLVDEATLQQMVDVWGNRFHAIGLTGAPGRATTLTCRG